MHAVIETGSDIATLCVYDPAALAGDFDAQLEANPVNAIQKAERERQLHAISTGADGNFILHFFVGEDPPARVMKACQEPAKVQELITPRGEIRATGGENITRNPPDAGDGSERESFRTEPGHYALKAWRAVWAEAELAEAAREREIAVIGPEAYSRRAKRGPWSALVVILLLLGGAFCIFATIASMSRGLFRWQTVVGLWVAWLALIQIVPRLLMRSDDQRATLASLNVQREFPDFVIHLTRISATT
jgi:hypothetical protein